MSKRPRISALSGWVGALFLTATSSLVACGTPAGDKAETEQLAQSLVSPETILPSSPTHECIPWEKGPRFCFAKCRPLTAKWVFVGSFPTIPFGDCSIEAMKYCSDKGGLDEYCWGIKK